MKNEDEVSGRLKMSRIKIGGWLSAGIFTVVILSLTGSTYAANSTTHDALFPASGTVYILPADYGEFGSESWLHECSFDLQRESCYPEFTSLRADVVERFLVYLDGMRESYCDFGYNELCGPIEAIRWDRVLDVIFPLEVQRGLGWHYLFKEYHLLTDDRSGFALPLRRAVAIHRLAPEVEIGFLYEEADVTETFVCTVDPTKGCATVAFIQWKDVFDHFAAHHAAQRRRTENSAVPLERGDLVWALQCNFDSQQHLLWLVDYRAGLRDRLGHAEGIGCPPKEWATTNVRDANFSLLHPVGTVVSAADCASWLLNSRRYDQIAFPSCDAFQAFLRVDMHEMLEQSFAGL